MFTVSVSGMKLPFRGGILKYEDRLLQSIVLHVDVEIESTDFAKSQSVEDTLDYALLVEICKKVSQQSWKLLEEIAMELEKQIRIVCSNALKITIKINKLPILGVAFDYVQIKLVTSSDH